MLNFVIVALSPSRTWDFNTQPNVLANEDCSYRNASDIAEPPALPHTETAASAARWYACETILG